jgi:hypothetical protein
MYLHNLSANIFYSFILASPEALKLDSVVQVPPKGAAIGSLPLSNAFFFQAGIESECSLC